MNTVQTGDILAIFSPDGIDMTVENGVTEMTALLSTAIGLCLTCGNKDDSVTPSTENLQYMGNEDEQPENKFRSRFLNMLNGRALSSQLVKDLSVAASLDIVDGLKGYVKTASCTVSIDANNKVTVSSKVEGIDGKFFYVESEIYKQ